jgi:DNA-binding transcriptional LysR family regulator
VRFEVTDPAARAVVLDQVRTGRVDFGLVDGPPPAGALASLELAEQQLLAVLPPGSGQGLTVTVVELVRLGLIGTPRGTALRTLLDAHLEAAGQATEVMVETAHVASVVPLVLAGAGAAVLPEGMAADAATKGARVARLEPESRASVSLVWRRDGLDAAATDFLDLVREHRSHPAP